MSFADQINALAIRVGTQFKTISAQIGPLSSLTTSNKASMVSALNEVNAKSGGVINDSASSPSTTYSSSKTDNQIAQAKADILGTASAAGDTLGELQAMIQNDETGAAALATAVGNRLRLDAAGSYTTAQQQQGRDNLSVYSQAQIGDPTTDFVATFNSSLA